MIRRAGRWFDGRVIGLHAVTIWTGQIAVMAFAIADTLIAGRYAPEALAALSVGTAIYISLYIGLQGFIQTLLPIWARLHGAGQPLALGFSVRQSLYITACCAPLGMVALLQGDHVMAWAQVPADLQPQVMAYLRVQALTLPLALLTRCFNTFSQSIGHPRWVSRLQTGGLILKVPLSIWLAFGGLGMPSLGLVGCAWATFLTHVVMLMVMADLLHRDAAYAPYQVWRWPEPPHGPTLRAFLRLGVPGSLVIWVEVTSFTAMALLVAPFGTTASAAQQIASNVAATLYMWPLALAIATSARISYWHGGGQPGLAAKSLRTGLWVAMCSAVVAALLLVMLREPIAAWYAGGQAAVAQLAASLLLLVALYHLADANQTMALFALRCFHVVRAPTVIYTVLLWGLGLGGGYALTHTSTLLVKGHEPHAFWVMATTALTLVAVLLLTLLRWTLRRAR